jgi:beta-catenin-like protein 1
MRHSQTKQLQSPKSIPNTMTSIDDLFKKPNLPAASSKRKFEEPDAQQAYKATKVSDSSSPHANGNALVEDAPEDDDDDMEAGPSLPPDEEDEGDDEEGRFFGGGVTGETAQALDYLDQQDGEDYKEEKIDSAWMKRLGASFERKIAKNAELRAKYESEPTKFMGSEADLDAEIKSWSLLSEHADLYPEFAKSNAVANLVGLLAHDNTDIAIGAIEILSELLDEDVEASQPQWDALATALLDADLLDLLMSNLGRLDESAETDRSGVYHSLSVLESLASQQPVAERIGTETVLNWLCNRIRTPETPLTQNKQYAAEVLQVLLQSSPLLRARLAKEVEGVDLFLQILAHYRKRDPPKDTPEEEYVENVFDALTCVLDERAGKMAFVEAEGVELALIMLKEGGFSKHRALRALDHAVGGSGGSEVGEACVAVGLKLVEAGGLKNIFSLFSKKPTPATMEHLLGIFASLLRWLPGESAARIRTLNKFTEKEYEKLGKLLQVRTEYAKRLSAVEDEIKLERRMMDEDDWAEREGEWFSRRLDHGLFGLQTVDVVLAWLVAEDPSAKEMVLAHLGGSLKDIKGSLSEQLDGVEDEDSKEMLGTLLSFLE